MRVIHCADYAGLYSGSFIPMLLAATTEASSRGYHTTVVLSEIARKRPWLPELERLADVRVIRVRASRWASVWATVGELHTLLGARPEPAVIHTHFATFDIPAALIRLRRPGVAVFWHEHTRLRTERRARLRNMLRYRGIGPLVTAILCVSPELLNDLRARGASARKLRRFPNAIDVRHFSPISASERSAARHALDLPDRTGVVLHFGWSWHVKGGDLMVAAARLLEIDRDLSMLTVLGEATASRPPAELIGNPIVRALEPTNDVKHLYAAADVFLSCSRAEGMPFAVLEALSCGLPIVATDLPIHQELLAGLPGAATVAPDPPAIAAAVSAMLSLSERDRIEHASLAQERIRSEFSLKAWARRLVDLYEEAVGTRSAG